MSVEMGGGPTVLDEIYLDVGPASVPRRGKATAFEIGGSLGLLQG